MPKTGRSLNKAKVCSIILLVILGAAVFLRLIHWTDVRADPFFADLVMDSQEYDRWALAIAGGDWIGSEVFFQAPFYPYFLAVFYAFFGHSLNIIYLIQIIAAAAGIYALYRTGRRLGGEVLGLAAAGLSALYAVYIFYDVQLLKESLVVSLVSFLLWVLVEVRESGKSYLWLIAGVLSGVLSLLRENMLLIVPLLFILTMKPGAKAWIYLKRCGFLLLGVVIILLPVALRNLSVGGIFAPTTFQGGVNFFIGNNPEATGTYQPIVPGKQVPYYERNEPIRLAEQEVGRELSPGEVSQYWMNKALNWALENPLDFARLQIKKFFMFWSWYEWPDAVDYYYVKGTSFVLRLPLLEFGGVFLLAAAGILLARKKLLMFFPVLLLAVGWMASTIVFFLFSRYRLPAVPCLMLLAAVPVSVLLESFKKKKLILSVVLSLFVLLSWIVPRAVGYSPRMELVHYNLGLISDGKGKLEEAEKHYLKALSINPDDFLSCVNLGNLAVREGDWKKALEWFEMAAGIEPGSDGVQSNLAGALVALGYFERAERHFDLALEINPANVFALHNKSILLANRGQIEQAKVLNTQVLNLLPGWEPALRLQAKLEMVRKDEKRP